MTVTATRPARERLPPHDLDAEESLLGACMLSRPAIVAGIDGHVHPDDFYETRHAAIWRAMLDLYADDQPIDPVTLGAYLRRHDQLEHIGGRQRLQELEANTPASAHAAAYAKAVHDAGAARKLLRLAGELADAVYAGEPTLNIIEALQHPATTDAHGWGAVDLGEVLRHDLRAPEPELLARDDGRALLYPGRIHAVNGESESLKTWLALHGVVQCIRERGNVALYLDFEDIAESVCARLLGLGLNAGEILEQFVYVRPDQALDLAAGQVLERIITSRRPELAVIDGVTEAMALEGLDLIDNADVAAWLTRLPRRIKDLGPAVVLIDHVAKHTENRKRGSIGAQHKLAGVDVAYLVEPIRPLAHVAAGNTDPITGASRIIVDKDRPGGVRAFAASRKYVGTLEITAYPDGGVTAHVRPAEELPEGGFRPTVLMEKISKLLESSPTPLTKKAVRAWVKAKNETKDLAIELLVGDGYVVIETGPRGAQLHRSVRPFRADKADGAPDDDEPDDDGTLPL